MKHLIGQHWEGDVRVTWWGDDVTHEVTIERWQDAELTLNKVAAVNLDGAPEVEGLGKAVAEIPVTVAMEYCEKRGIPWEKLLYSNEYDAEFRRFIAEYSKLRYENHRKVAA